MPELFRPNAFVDELQIRAAQEQWPEDDEFIDNTERLVAQYPDVEYLGVGVQSVVVGNPEDPEKVLAYEHKHFVRKSYGVPGEKYHIHRVLSILYPTEFPRIYAHAQGEHAGSVRQRVYERKNNIPKKWYETRSKWREKVQQAEEERIESFEYLGEDVGLTINVDYISSNFRVTSDDKPVYLDFVLNNSLEFNMSIDAALNFIRERRMRRAQDPTIPQAYGIMDEERSFLLSMRRIREINLIYEMRRSGKPPSIADIRKVLADITCHLPFKNSQEKLHFYKSSRQRIIDIVDYLKTEASRV